MGVGGGQRGFEVAGKMQRGEEGKRGEGEGRRTGERDTKDEP